MASEYSPTTEHLFTVASQAMTQANNSENRIAGLTKPTLTNPNFSFAVVKPTLSPPPELTDVFDGSDSVQDTINMLNAQVDAWLDSYFPNITGCLKTLPDDFLCDVISGARPFGYSGTYFELVWHQARDRAQRTRQSEVATLDAEFSARGFALPPGAYVAAIDAATQRASDTVLEVNRDQAIKDAEVRLELLKFAEEQALKYKLGVMQAMADFYRQWAELPDKDIERARIKAQATAALYAALSSYYNVEVAFEQLRLRAAETDVNVDLDVDKNKINLFASDNSANPALGQAVRGFADVAAAAASAAGTLVAQIESV